MSEAAGELERSGFELLHGAREEPWGQTVARLQSARGRDRRHRPHARAPRRQLTQTPAARRALRCVCALELVVERGELAGIEAERAAISQSANHTFFGSSGPCR